MGLFNHHDDKYKGLSDEDRKVLEQAHGNLNDHDKQIVQDSYSNKNNPDHPANPDHPEHGKFKQAMGGVSQKMGNAAIFGFGASAGASLFNNIF
ncbi:hypothetical protein LTR91_015552 [Friedmanniomyces endolithicus]|uniref:Uncharacterized protein n=1 Tax=Friedmanniomyces endolithicus TaxID=329885 RepID=A0AAN6FV80_9PEZI|nr:hypothetical protein LTS00_011048 [Friedmanniomyces endolithicus]KAK0293606.1 hypothetical protein LTR35_000210 [Friedmanniomyces endolithicus]KAK0324122.1 hypothetical protein LTR82_004558 [Friedmanniomyces endolithicus]KAK0365295.1 hypothetical protein LTR94_007536 [Friedmanniomyces endolithicus]KAK0805560.1 hypothetical protein LTR38_005461 [Friedmanniomyces endolithicus]